MSKKGQRQRRRLQQSAPPSGQKPQMPLAPRDLKAMAEEVVRYHVHTGTKDNCAAAEGR